MWFGFRLRKSAKWINHRVWEWEDIPPEHVAVGNMSTDGTVAVLGVGLVQPSSIWEPEGLTRKAVCLSPSVISLMRRRRDQWGELTISKKWLTIIN